jgi:hypothetical protein
MNFEENGEDYMIKYWLIILILIFNTQISKAQTTIHSINSFYDECNSSRYLEFSIARINIYKLYYSKAVLLNLNGKQKWDYVRELINKDDDELFKFRRNRDQSNPATSDSEVLSRKKYDTLYDVMLSGALIIFNENIDPKNIDRINRRIVEECTKMVSKIK